MTDVQGLLHFIYGAENRGRVDYDVIYGGVPAMARPATPPTSMTVGEVYKWQMDNRGKWGSTAIGALQVMPETLKGLVESGVVSKDDMFDQATQDRMTVALMRRRGLDEWQAGRMSTEDFGTNLAKEWASLPVLKSTYRKGNFIPRGNAYYGGVGPNKSRALVSASALTEQLGNPGRLVVSSQDYAGTGTVGAMLDYAGTAMPGSMGRRMAAQYDTADAPDEYRHMAPWEKPDVDLDGGSGFEGSGAIPAAQDVDMPDMPHSNYRTRTGPGGGAILQGWGQAFHDTFQDSYVYRGIQAKVIGSRYEWDTEFNPLDQAEQDGMLNHQKILGVARNKDHYDELVRGIEADNLRQRRMDVWDGTAAHTLGALLNPDSIVSMGVPIGGVAGAAFRGAGGNFARTGAKTMFLTGAAETALEAGRSRHDPNATQLDSVVRIGGATILSGLIGGGIGVLAGTAQRRGLADKLAREIAEANGVGRTTETVDLGRGKRGRVVIKGLLEEGPVDGPTVRWVDDASGVRVVGEVIEVDPDVIRRRFKAGAHDSSAKSPTELAEYEVARASALARYAREFFGDDAGAAGKGAGRKGYDPFIAVDKSGKAKVSHKGIKAAMERGEPIALGPAKGSPQHGKIKPVLIKPGVFKSAKEASDAVRAAHELAAKARDTGEFRDMLGVHLNRGFDEIEPENVVRDRRHAEARAKVDAEKALETYRRENNRVLQDARMEALARLTDGPYKRIHRNALSPEARDLVDKLAADGGFLRGSDETGRTVGPSVYSRAKTWAGVTRRLYDAEGGLFEKYLGFDSNPNVADVSVNKSLRKHRASGEKSITIEEFRARTTKAYISGEKDDIPEIMEMVEVLRGAFDEYNVTAAEYGVITTAETLQRQMTHLQARLSDLAAYGPEPDSRVARLQEQLEEIRRMHEIAKQEPGEDYFTRIWNRRAIEDNRDFFIEKVIMPWMMQQPRIQMWVVGMDDLKAQYMEILKEFGDHHPKAVEMRKRMSGDNIPDRSKYEWIEASTDPAQVRARAHKMVDEILGEAEPEDLTTLREAHRPVFGRHRQLNIPNAMLLAEGGRGNGVADFIETDYLLVHQIYQERMGPAIEMARSFARPLDGISARDGFEEAMQHAKVEEGRRWRGVNGTGDGFGAHWAKIERDMLHLKDRVTNRVIRDPNRWDNRTATALRNWSHLAFMGMSALPATQEIGTIIMRHGLGRTMQHAFGQLDEGMEMAAKLGVEEMRKAGAIMEVVNGAALSRFAETGMEATTGTAPERWLKHAANKYFMWNGLAPLSTRLKELDAGLRVHDMLERINRVAEMQRGAPKGDIEELARWGISMEDASRMAKEPIEEIEGGHLVANTDMWADEDLVRTFRAAIAQGNENTVLMATAADKPTIMDGTFYLRAGGRVDEYAQRAGLRKVGDFWQVQSGLMTLPFTFWNYAIAAHNKILVAGLDEPTAQKLGGIAALVGMGYMVAQVRAPDWKWNSMDAHERLFAAIDQSGVMGIMSQFAGIAEQPTPVDMALRAAGAGPSVLGNAVGGAIEGDANRMSWALPYRNHFMLKGIFDRFTDAIERAAG